MVVCFRLENDFLRTERVGLEFLDRAFTLWVQYLVSCSSREVILGEALDLTFSMYSFFICKLLYCTFFRWIQSSLSESGSQRTTLSLLNLNLSTQSRSFPLFFLGRSASLMGETSRSFLLIIEIINLQDGGYNLQAFVIYPVEATPPPTQPFLPFYSSFRPHWCLCCWILQADLPYLQIYSPSQQNYMQHPIQIADPSKYLRTNLNIQTFGERRFTYFIAEKNNERFLGHHTRFFILLEDNTSHIKEFGYAREFPQGQKIPFGEERLLPNRKLSFLIDNIKELKFDKKQSIEIAFTHNGKNITWEIKCDNQPMAANVNNLLENARSAIINVVYNDMVNQTSETLTPGKTNPPQQSKPITQEPAPLNSNASPFASGNQPRGSKELQQNQDNANQQINNNLGNNLGSILENPVQNSKETNERVNMRAFTLSGDLQNESKLETPLTKSLLTKPEQNQRQKQQFIKKMQEHKAKQQGTLIKSTLSTYQKQAFGGVSEEVLRSQAEKIQKRQTVISNQNQLWNYQFLKGNQENLVMKFKNFTENLVCQLIDSLCLPESQRLYHPINEASSYHEYEIQGLKIRLCFTGISEIKLLKNSKDTVYDEQSLKAALRQFKNMDYLLSVTRNKGKIRLPLANIVEYKGIVSLIKADIEADEKQQAVSLFNEFDIISKEARIKKQVFADPKSLRILPLLSRTYQKHSKTQSPIKRAQPSLEVFYLDDVRHFLPVDFNFVERDPQNNILRSEFLQNEDLDGKQLMGLNIEPFLNRSKTERGIQQAFRDLEAASKGLIETVGNLLDEWQGLQQITITSQEVGRLFHKHGVNMRYLGMIYDKATVPLIRRICMSQMVARVAKIILRVRLQETIRSYADSMAPQEAERKDKLVTLCECNQHLVSIVVDFLNEVSSETPQSESTWKAMNKQAQYKFNISISKLEVYEPYLLQALIHSCNIKFDWSKFPKNASLFRGRLFRRDMILGFDVRSKNYNLNFTDIYVKVISLIEEGTSESVEQLKSILNLRKVNIPDHFKLNDLYQRIALLLSNYIELKPLESSGNALPCTSIYELVLEEPPSYTTISLAIMEIKWVLKHDNISKAQKLFRQLLTRISEWCGDIHPVLTQIYSMFAQYYLLKGEFEEATNFSKSALANQTKILGGVHQKIAQRYYQLAQIGFKASRKQDSLANYRKAKNICDNINQVDTIPYAEICYKVAVLSLELNKLPQAEASCRTAIGIFQMNRGEEGNYEKESVDCYELLLRIYEVWGKREDMEKISFYCGQSLEDFKQISNLERVMRIFLIPYLLGVKRKQAQKMASLFEQIPLQLSASSYSSACTYIKRLIDTESLLSTVQELFDNFNEIHDEVVENSVLTRWRGFETEGKTSAYQCISLVEALIYFLGEGFVIGSLKER